MINRLLLMILFVISVMGCSCSTTIVTPQDTNTARITTVTVTDDLTKELAFNLLQATVRVKIKRDGPEAGSGVVLFSQAAHIGTESKAYTYVLTCFHVVGGNSKVFVEEFQYAHKQNINAITSWNADVIAIDLEKDLALLQITGNRLFESTVNLITESELKETSIYEKIFAIGCTVGRPPIITHGHLVNYDLEGYYAITSPICFGNSGGGVFTVNGKLIGLAHGMLMLRTPQPNVSIPITTYGYATPITAIRSFLNDAKAKFILSKNTTLKEFLLNQELQNELENKQK